MKKMKSSNLQGLEKHNERENKSYKNKEIDHSKSKENLSLMKDDRPYLERVESIINENYTRNYKIRTDQVKCNSFIIGASPEYMKSLNRNEQIQYFKDAKDYFVEKYEHVAYAKIHFDESNPHLHLGVVPLVKDHEKGYTTLSSKRLFDRQSLRDLQSEFPKYLKEKGYEIERGLPNAQKKYIKDIENYKKQNHKEVLEYLKKLEKIKEKYRLKEFTDREPKGILKKNFRFDKDEFEDLKNIINKIDKLVSDNINYQNKLDELGRQNKNLEHDNKKLINKVNDLKLEINKDFDIKKMVYDYCDVLDKDFSEINKISNFKKVVSNYKFWDKQVHDSLEKPMKEIGKENVTRLKYDGFKGLSKSISKELIDKYNLNLDDKDIRACESYARQGVTNYIKENPVFEYDPKDKSVLYNRKLEKQLTRNKSLGMNL